MDLTLATHRFSSICHTAPYFDYTVFARVCSGMNVVDEIQEGIALPRSDPSATQAAADRALPNPYLFLSGCSGSEATSFVWL